jgi:ribosome maturation factor RimP
LFTIGLIADIVNKAVGKLMRNPIANDLIQIRITSETKPTLIRVLARDKTNDKINDMKKLSKIVEAIVLFFR